ncbi:MAG: Bro-N domain-containing protein [Thermodesulfobacteriota bacterium]|nr:Bro-N domain-containing protein [Thermodesulfobacteriota bacterium]
MVTEIVRQEEFEGMQLAVIEQDGEEWFSAEDIGKALGFSEPRKNVLKIYERNRDEFEGLRRVVNLTTWLKSGGKLPYRFTTFNPQGAYLLAILARTPKSKALRRWLAKFMAHDLNRLKDHVAQLETRHQADQTLIAELETEAQRQRDQALSKITWDDVEEMPVWFWGLNARIKALEAKERELKAQTIPVIPDDLALILAKDLRRLRDLAAPAHSAEAQRLMHKTLVAQAEWDAVAKLDRGSPVCRKLKIVS